MPEVVQIALSQFAKFGLVFAFGYGVYRLVRFKTLCVITVFAPLAGIGFRFR